MRSSPSMVGQEMLELDPKLSPCVPSLSPPGPPRCDRHCAHGICLVLPGSCSGSEISVPRGQAAPTRPWWPSQSLLQPQVDIS